MTKQINFEDTIFILNVRIRMISDLLRLDTDSELFLDKTIDDLVFIGSILNVLAEKLLANTRFLDRNQSADNLSDIEWRFSKLLMEFSAESSHFSVNRFPNTAQIISGLRMDSENRNKLISSNLVTANYSMSEPVVSIMEMKELLGN